MLKATLLIVVMSVILGLGALYFNNYQINTSVPLAKVTNTNNTQLHLEKDNDTPIKNGMNMPANILSTESKNSITYFVLDYLELNPCFTPGGPLKAGCTNSEYFKNDVDERSAVPLSVNANVFYCFVDYGDHEDHGISGDDTVPDAPYPLKEFLNQDNVGGVYYFDIKNDEITAIYQQCLP